MVSLCGLVRRLPGMVDSRAGSKQEAANCIVRGVVSGRRLRALAYRATVSVSGWGCGEKSNMWRLNQTPGWLPTRTAWTINARASTSTLGCTPARVVWSNDGPTSRMGAAARAAHVEDESSSACATILPAMR